MKRNSSEGVPGVVLVVLEGVETGLSSCFLCALPVQGDCICMRSDGCCAVYETRATSYRRVTKPFAMAVGVCIGSVTLKGSRSRQSFFAVP